MLTPKTKVHDFATEIRLTVFPPFRATTHRLLSSERTRPALPISASLQTMRQRTISSVLRRAGYDGNGLPVPDTRLKFSRLVVRCTKEPLGKKLSYIKRFKEGNEAAFKSEGTKSGVPSRREGKWKFCAGIEAKPLWNKNAEEKMGSLCSARYAILAKAPCRVAVDGDSYIASVAGNKAGEPMPCACQHAAVGMPDTAT